MIRILDRYVGGLFLSAAGAFLAVFSALFVLVDFVSKARSFLDLKQAILPFVLEYYLLRLPSLLVYVLPMVTLFAAVFTLLRLARTNELVPIVTAGVPMLRLIRPALLTALLCGAGMFALDELVIPAVSERSAEMDSIIASGETTWDVFAHDEQGYRLFGRYYEYVHRKIVDPTVLLIEDGKTRFRIQAAYGTYNDAERTWTFYEGVRLDYDAQGQPMQIVLPDTPPDDDERPLPKEGLSLSLGIVPADLQRRQFFSARPERLAELSRKIEAYPHVPVFRMRFHARFAHALTPLVLLLIGVPFVVAPGSRGILKGLGQTLVLCALYYGVHFGGLDLGSRGALPPELSAWVPTALFGVVGVVFTTRMNT